MDTDPQVRRSTMWLVFGGSFYREMGGAMQPAIFWGVNNGREYGKPGTQLGMAPVRTILFEQCPTRLANCIDSLLKV